MKKLSMAELHRLNIAQYKDAEKTPVAVILDNVRSHNNVGSVFRTADAFRMSLHLCGITATPPHRDIHKTALGAEDSVEWQYHESTQACVQQLKEKGYLIYAIEQVDTSTLLHQWRPPQGKPIAIILGNELDGVQDALLPLCDGCIEIPQYGTKHSLNISCAAAIVMWDLYKQIKLL